MPYITIPREPRAGDIFTGEVKKFRHPGFSVSSDIPLYMPLALVDTNLSNPEALVGRWVECEVVKVDVEKRAVVVRPVLWLEDDDDIRASRIRTLNFWYPGLIPSSLANHNSE